MPAIQRLIAPLRGFATMQRSNPIGINSKKRVGSSLNAELDLLALGDTLLI